MDPHHAPPVCGKSASARPQGPLSSRSTNTTPTRPCIPHRGSIHLGTTSDPGECAGISDYAPSACRAPPVQRQGGAQRFEATCRPRRNENPRASGDAGAVRRDPPQTGPDRRTEGEAGRKEKRERRGGEERDGGKADVPRYLRYPRVGVSPKSAGAFHDTVSLCISGRAGDTCVLLVLGEVETDSGTRRIRPVRPGQNRATRGPVLTGTFAQVEPGRTVNRSRPAPTRGGPSLSRLP